MLRFPVSSLHHCAWRTFTQVKPFSKQTSQITNTCAIQRRRNARSNLSACGFDTMLAIVACEYAINICIQRLGHNIQHWNVQILFYYASIFRHSFRLLLSSNTVLRGFCLDTFFITSPNVCKQPHSSKRMPSSVIPCGQQLTRARRCNVDYLRLFLFWIDCLHLCVWRILSFRSFISLFFL